jgi:hypothetical protein
LSLRIDPLPFNPKEKISAQKGDVGHKGDRVDGDYDGKPQTSLVISSLS